MSQWGPGLLACTSRCNGDPLVKSRRSAALLNGFCDSPPPPPPPPPRPTGRALIKHARCACSFNRRLWSIFMSAVETNDNHAAAAQIKMPEHRQYRACS